MHIVILTVLTVKILKFYKSTMVAVAILTKNRKTASLTDLHHPVPLILPNKTRKAQILLNKTGISFA